MQEAAKLRDLRIRRKRLEAVDDDHPRTALLDQRAHLLEDTGEAALVENGAEVLVEDGAADRFRIEEAERLTVPKDLVERFRHRGEVEGGPLGRGVREQVLLGEDRLAGPGQPDQHVDRVRREAAAEHGVEARMAAQETPAHRDVAPCRKALFPSRSLTVETNCRGSSGFWRKASAPAASAWSRASSVEIARQAGTPALLQALAQIDARSTGDEQLDHCELRQLLLEFARGVVGIEGESDLIALGVKEELGELCRVRITLGKEDQKARRRLALIRRAEVATALEPLAEHAVGFGRLQPPIESLLDEAELLDLGAGVEPVAPLAPLRLHKPVALLPVTDRRGRDAQHPLHGADAVDRKTLRQDAAAYLLISDNARPRLTHALSNTSSNTSSVRPYFISNGLLSNIVNSSARIEAPEVDAAKSGRTPVAGETAGSQAGAADTDDHVRGERLRSPARDQAVELYEALRRENDQLRTALATRIVIEQAKGMLAQRFDLDVDEAFERLRREARNRRMKLHVLAAAVVAREAWLEAILRTGRRS